VRTYHEVQDDRLLALAAGVVFYTLVALFPALAAGVSVYALFADAATIANHLSVAADVETARQTRSSIGPNSLDIPPRPQRYFWNF
jgi:membrane protein